MRLKRLELHGFKSFADQTVLNFEHDLIGIVGPNGCGKSNVVDAVRWILGEQRAKSMRGSEMTDVIFKGSASRPAMGLAEGTLVFDNQHGVLEGHGEEVSVTRRVYRSGEGEYQIDGTRVRLKDIKEMLFGTGLGSRGYSVLEQGKIDAILSANPLERRAIFEEAAGVSRYRQRKKEAESRLKRVQADLLRLDDVVGELEKRERSLKIQAGKARRFLEARDAWREDGHRLACHQLHSMAASIAEIGRELMTLEASVEAQRSERGSSEESVNQQEAALGELGAELNTASEDSAELGAELRALDERGKQLRVRIEAWEASSEDEARRVKLLGERFEERSLERDQLVGQVEEFESAFDQANQRAHRLSQQSEGIVQAHRDITRESQEKNNRVLRLFQDLNSTRNRLQHLGESLEPLSEREARSEARRSEAQGEVEAVQTSEQAACAELGSIEEQLQVNQTACESSEQEGVQLDERLLELDERRSELALTCARLSSRVESLRDWEREREGLGAGTREFLEALESSAGPELKSELQGLLADHLAVDSRVARALDVALGKRAQALVINAPGDASSIVRWLKQEQKGRIALVLPKALAQVEALPLPAELLARDGVSGALLAEVRPAEGFAPLAQALLGKVVLVDSVELGLELIQSYPELRFVTSEGDIVDLAGVRGGHTEVSQGAIGRRATAAELEEERLLSEQELERVGQQVTAERARRVDAAARLSELREALSASRVERTRALSHRDSMRARLQELQRAVDLSERECASLAAERQRVEGELAQSQTRLEELEAEYNSSKSDLEQLEQQKEVLEQERQERSQEEGQARVEAAGFQERRDSLRRRRQDVESSWEELRGELERAERLTREHKANAEAGVLEADALQEQGLAMAEQRAALELRVESLRVQEREGRAAIETLRRHAESLTGQLETLLDRVSQTRLEKQRQELEREEIARRGEEDFHKSAHELLEDFEPEEELAESSALRVLELRVVDLKKSMEKLGPVNLEAVEELEEVSERLGFLTTQRSDLHEARRAVESTLEELNQESEKRFIEAFDEIQAGFKVLFRQLFGGGRAEINLLDKEDVLECGIEIIARPPGREALPISLLSGGQRTLTALALLFAVFKRNSSPFCILDEVDAALDEANIGRFLSMIESNLKDTQYVVVTHNKGTMSACQVLYGVTMATKGVSNVVSVELESADDFVPQAVGEARGELIPPVLEAEEEDEEPQVELEPVAKAATAPEPEAAEAESEELGADGSEHPPKPAEDGEREVVMIPGLGVQKD